MSTQEEYLSAIAEAIREKDGTTKPIPANTFPDRILAITTGGSDFAVPLVVTVDAGAEVTAKNGDIEITSISGDDNTAHLILTSEGDWTVSATLGNKYTAPKTVKVTSFSENLTLVAGILTYHGKATEFAARARLASAAIGNYALFGGGYGSARYKTVDVYDQDLTRTTATALSTQADCLTATATRNYALFGGGYSSTYASATVTAYTPELTCTTVTGLSTARANLASTAVGDYALFGGGQVKQSTQTTNYSSKVDAYDQDLTRTTPTALSAAKSFLASTAVGDYALFGGGTSSSKVVDVYSADLTRTTAVELSVGRNSLASTAVGDYALFGGGSGSSKVVDVYSADLTRTTAVELSVGRYYLSSTTVVDYALFAGGSGPSSAVDAYTPELTKETVAALSNSRYNLAATTVGNYALFGGGQSNASSYFGVVDTYTVE